MVQPVVQPNGGPDHATIKNLPPGERSRYYEAGILSLLNANGDRGLSTAEIERATGFPKGTLLKSLDALYHQRLVHRVSHGQFRLYYAHRTAVAPARDILFGDRGERRYSAKRVANVSGDFVRIEEKEVDEDGFARTVGGVLVPASKVGEVVNMLNAASTRDRAAVIR